MARSGLLFDVVSKGLTAFKSHAPVAVTGPVL